MKLSEAVLKQLQEDVGKSKTIDDLLGKNGALIEELLEAEMTEHLGYDKHAKSLKETENCRNGSSCKTLKSQFGLNNLYTQKNLQSRAFRTADFRLSGLTNLGTPAK